MSHRQRTLESFTRHLSNRLKRRSRTLESDQVTDADADTTASRSELSNVAIMNDDGSLEGLGSASVALDGMQDVDEDGRERMDNLMNGTGDQEQAPLFKHPRSKTISAGMHVGNGNNGDRITNGENDKPGHANDHRYSIPSSGQDLDALFEHSQLETNGGNGIFDGSRAATGLIGPSGESSPRRGGPDRVLKLSPSKIQELTSSPESVPYRIFPFPSTLDEAQKDESEQLLDGETETARDTPVMKVRGRKDSHPRGRPHALRTFSTPTPSRRPVQLSSNSERLSQTWASRTRQGRPGGNGRIDLDLKNPNLVPPSQQIADPLPSPMPLSIPLPPLSIPTYLQLELASGRPSPLYIHRSVPSEFPYESSRVKLERLVNFLMLPPALEQVLWFGALACLDSWLYSFTILPLRFIKAVYILLESWVVNIGVEVRYISTFVVKGIGRVWRRKTQSVAGTELESRSRTVSGSSARVETLDGGERDARGKSLEPGRRHRRPDGQKSHHRRQKSIPSALLPDDKADILKGLLMIATCSVLMYFDASRMYHWIRGQAAIKLYVIYNVLEVSDRLLAAIGQDVLECLFSREALERKPDGRSKVLRPSWLFLLALAYTVLHATALFYQVMTLNVAVNSYSNALITLLLSNQFVEIKSTVFKKFEKENLFQLTCADVVERFQLWLMLTIIALRNIVETGAFDIFGSLGSSFGSSLSTSTNSTPLSTPPRTATSILPKSFTLFPSSLISSFSGNSFISTLGQVMGPFLVVLGSEMIVDWLKHAYINKFNNTRPAIYGRFLDILAKDYYTNAFVDQNLTRRLGLPVIPLSCLFFRIFVQTYQMFLASLLPYPPSSSTAVEAPTLSSIHNSHYFSSSPSPAAVPLTSPITLKNIIPTSAAHINAFFRAMLANAMPTPARSVQIFTVVLILTGFVALLIVKLMLGMLLLNFAQSRYKSMKNHEISRQQRQQQQQQQHHSQTPAATTASTSTSTNNNASDDSWGSVLADSMGSDSRNRGHAVDGSRRVGGWGVVEVNDDKRRWIYVDDPEGLRRLKEKEDKEREKSFKESTGGIGGMEHVTRYEMVAKRIW